MYIPDHFEILSKLGCPRRYINAILRIFVSISTHTLPSGALNGSINYVGPFHPLDIRKNPIQYFLASGLANTKRFYLHNITNISFISN